MLENPLAAAKISLGNKKKSCRHLTSAFKPSSRQSRALPMERVPVTRSCTASCSTAVNHQRQLKSGLTCLSGLWPAGKTRDPLYINWRRCCWIRADQDLLHTIIYSLFCPTTEVETDLSQGPGKSNGGQDPRLVELFSPEFCLKIGDTFVQAMRKPTENGKEGTN